MMRFRKFGYILNGLPNPGAVPRLSVEEREKTKLTRMGGIFETREKNFF